MHTVEQERHEINGRSIKVNDISQGLNAASRHIDEQVAALLTF